MITLHKRQLFAATECAASKDIRYHMNGVHVECAASGDVHIVSTDGSMMFVGRIPASDVVWTDGAQRGPWRLTIPLDTVKRECKGSGDHVTMSAMHDGRYQLGATVFTPVEGKFLDWRRVLPADTVECEDPLQVNPSLVLSACVAVRVWHGSKKDVAGATFIEHLVAPSSINMGHGFARVIGGSANAYAVVMPMRSDRTNFPVSVFKPCAYEETP